MIGLSRRNLLLLLLSVNGSGVAAGKADALVFVWGNKSLDYFSIAPEALLLGIRGGSASTVEETETVVDTSSVTDQNATTRKVLLKPDYDSDPSQFKFSLFKKGDGSEDDPDGIPKRYILMQENDRPKAKAALDATLKWRRDNKVDTVLQRPHPKYDLCKAVAPHYFGGRDDDGHVVLLQRPGLANVSRMHSLNITKDDLVLHTMYVLEYCWNVIEPDPLHTMVSLVDLTGINFSFLRKTDLVSFVKRTVHMIDSHYPQRAHKTLLLNCPKWFGTLYKLISPLLRETTKAKIEIYHKGSKQDAALKKYLGAKSSKAVMETLRSSPDEDSPLKSSVMEKDMRNFCMARLKDSGVPMLEVTA